LWLKLFMEAAMSTSTANRSGRVAQAFWVAEPGRGEIRASELREARPAEIVVATRYSGISRGTESLVFRGEVPESQRLVMTAPFQEGRFPAPVKYGYSTVGVVEDGATALAGRLVFCLHPHHTRFVVPASAAVPLPEGVPAGRAVLAANAETAVNGLWDASLRLGDRVAVIGAGAVGCLVAFFAAAWRGCEVLLMDIDPSKAVVAERLGLSFAAPDGVEQEFDLVIHTSGHPAGLATALRLTGLESTVLELSWYGAALVPVPLGEWFHSRRLTLRASQVGHVAASQRARWDRTRRMALALSLLRDDRLDALISGESDFERLPELMGWLASGPPGVVCHRIRYPGE
jgi:NADPH:quinone reductase-like Zn-dependent oxidoreductase